ncbi:MAG: bifunctional UDP-N-acetylglucosamine diphosphorylase/glucosamine-1-phosphate N-acetyltransferase GlmU [Thermoleophilia bacterium]
MNSSISTAVILAAGLGTRMKSSTPKVLHEVCGLPLISHILEAVAQVGAERTVVVLGPGHERVRPVLPEGVEVALQLEPRGTGDALLKAAAFLEDGPALVVPGDTPLITGEVLRDLVGHHVETGAQATILTMILENPGGYGRVVRDETGAVTRIVEQRDATPEELEIREVNSGMYVLPGRRSLGLLEEVGSDNEQGEVYLTDVVEGLVAAGAKVEAVAAPDPSVTLGVNTRVDLARVAALMRGRILNRWMLEGVTIDDPSSTYVDVSVELEADVRILPGTTLSGATVVGRDSVIGPATTLIDTAVGRGSRVRHAYAEGASIGDGVQVGPFCYLRPGARLERGSKAGTFVEIKNSTVGEGSKVPHLSYIGDTTIGRETNIGAGNITANYDGRRKHRTVIGDGVHTGSDTVFVAPVTIGDKAVTGAGSIITKNVPEAGLGIARCRQKNIEGYADRRGVEPGEDSEHGAK